ncbi:hypothetical protein WDR88_003360 [Enterobacter cloacae]|nr:hypothetical protein [Enterobacter cloacae]
MQKHGTEKIYQALENMGLAPLRIRDGIHVVDVQGRIVAHYACPIGNESHWEIWPTPTYPLSHDKLTSAYPLTKEILFQFSLVEGDEKNKQQALNKLAYNESVFIENE